MAEKNAAADILSDGKSSPVQPSQPAPSVAADASPSDPNLVSIPYLRSGESRSSLAQADWNND